MSPHMDYPLRHSSEHNVELDTGSPEVIGWSSPDGAVQQPARDKERSLLRSVPEDEVHDMLCVGFGPASLAIAVALHDALEKGEAPPELAGLEGRPPKVAFFEKQARFAWHEGMLLPGAKMQITFVKDMATLRDPRSRFTFLNYLHKKERLVQFTNLSTFLPQRIEYEDYMRWCAGQFEDVVSYNQEVVDVSPEHSSGYKGVQTFVVTSKNTRTDELTRRRARNVVIAVGGRAVIPPPFPQSHPRVIHSSQFEKTIRNILPDSRAAYKVAVIGAGQSAGEIFNELHTAYPNCRTRLLIKTAALKPSDDSPFVNEIFDPSRVDDVYHRSANLRAESIKQDKSTNYGVVRLELLEHIYSTLYTQRIRSADEETWQHRILPYRTVTGVETSGKTGVTLHIRNDSGKYMAHESSGDETIDVDLVVVAAGYARDVHEMLLQPARGLMRGGDVQGNKWEVERNYRVKFQQGAVAEGSGVWLQGCNENTHGLSDTLLSILAVRGGEVVQSIFGRKGLSKGQAHTNGVNGHIEGNGVNGHEKNNGVGGPVGSKGVNGYA